MIQRIQTVYLALLVISLGLAFVFPFSTFPIEGGVLTLDAFGISREIPSVSIWFPYYVVLAMSMGLGIITISQFKKRKKQLQLGKLNYIIILISLVFIFIDSDRIAEGVGAMETDISYGIGMFSPVVALVFQFLANRGIKADEKLIKSMDRLR